MVESVSMDYGDDNYMGNYIEKRAILVLRAPRVWDRGV